MESIIITNENINSIDYTNLSEVIIDGKLIKNNVNTLLNELMNRDIITKLIIKLNKNLFTIPILPNLTSLEIINCSNFSSLPTLPKLTYLYMSNLKNIIFNYN